MNSPAPIAPPTPVIVPAVPWYKNPEYVLAVSVVGAALCGLFPQLPKFLGKAGVHTASDFLVLAGAVTTLIGGLAIAIKKMLSKMHPITWTQKAADEHVNTVATAITQEAMRQADIPTNAEAKTALLAETKAPGKS